MASSPLSLRHLRLEARRLILRIVEFGEAIGKLAPRQEEFEAIGDEGSDHSASANGDTSTPGRRRRTSAPSGSARPSSRKSRSAASPAVAITERNRQPEEVLASAQGRRDPQHRRIQLGCLVDCSTVTRRNGLPSSPGTTLVLDAAAALERLRQAAQRLPPSPSDRGNPRTPGTGSSMVNSGLWRVGKRKPSLRNTRFNSYTRSNRPRPDASDIAPGAMLVHVVDVVMGAERPCRSAAGNGLHHRRLDFQEVERIEIVTQVAHDA